MKKTKGFTLIELVMVIVILGILAAVAVPKFANLSGKARQGAVNGEIAAISSGITIKFAEADGIYPSVLDAVADGEIGSTTNRLFVDVIQNGITKPYWKKIASKSYEAHYSSGNAATGTADETYYYIDSVGVFSTDATAQ